jgi:hypothetical protein
MAKTEHCLNILSIEFQLTIEKKMTNIQKMTEEDFLLTNEQYATKSMDEFISEILSAEQRILKKLSEIHKQKTVINLYKESILIRELFACIARRFNFQFQLSGEQYTIAKRVWNKAFETAVYASAHIQNESIIKSIEKRLIHVFADKKALH